MCIHRRSQEVTTEVEQEMYHLFRRMNRARNTAIAAHPAYLTTLMRPHKLNAHVMTSIKSPLLSVLNNYGSRTAPTAVYVAPAHTGYKPLLPVIDVISGHIYATDPRGGLSVPIVNGEPRIFMPLSIHRGQQLPSSEWMGMAPVRVDTGEKMGSGQGAGAGPVSPKHAGKSPSFGRMMSWLGMGSTKSP